MDGIKITNFMKNVDDQHEIALLVGDFSLPLDNKINALIKRFLPSVVVLKIFKLPTEKMCELEALWLTSLFKHHCKIHCFALYKVCAVAVRHTHSI